jgi:thioredoxin-like negative regulator of GroEL
MLPISRPASLAATSLVAAFIGLASLFFIGCDGPSHSVPTAKIPADAIQKLVGPEDDQNLVLIKFGAPWCGPCRQVDKEIASLAATLPEDVRVVTVDVDTNPEAVVNFGIEGIPRMFLVRNGEVLADEVGYRSESELRNWVASYQ